MPHQPETLDRSTQRGPLEPSSVPKGARRIPHRPGRLGQAARFFSWGVFGCLLSCHTQKTDTLPQTQTPTTQAAPQTPNRFDSLAWPEVTTSDRLFFATRLAPTFLEALDAKRITLAMLSEATAPNTLAPFLSQGLPEVAEAPSDSAPKDLAAVARAALLLGPASVQWATLEASLAAQQKALRLTPLAPPGEILLEPAKITIRFQMTDGFEWFSYLVCKAVLRGNEDLRVEFLGEQAKDPYTWTAGEEELCLWSLVGSREHIKTQANMNRAPSPDPSLVRLDAALQKGHLLGFVLVEFLLPRRGSLAGLSEKQLDAAVTYLLSEALTTGNGG